MVFIDLIVTTKIARIMVGDVGGLWGDAPWFDFPIFHQFGDEI